MLAMPTVEPPVAPITKSHAAATGIRVGAVPPGLASGEPPGEREDAQAEDRASYQ